MRENALRANPGTQATVDVQGAEALLPRTVANQQAIALLRRDAAERAETHQGSRSSTWGGPSPAEAGVGRGRSDRVLASLQSSLGIADVSDPRRQPTAVGAQGGPAPEQAQAADAAPVLAPTELTQRHAEDREALRAYMESRPTAHPAGAEALAQDIASMLVVLGELGDTPTPNPLDQQSVEEFMDMLETALQARQAVRLNPYWDQASSRT
eukprot:462697-Amphidinium_carterae.1